MGLCYLQLTLHPLDVPRFFAAVFLKPELEEIFSRDDTAFFLVLLLLSCTGYLFLFIVATHSKGF